MKADINKSEEINFNNLVESIRKINIEFSIQAKKAVNTSLTLRNWFIGGFISNYELNGSDRAKYGENLLTNLDKKLKNISNCNRRQLYDYLQFYRVYPQIVRSVSAQLQVTLPEGVTDIVQKVPTASALSSVNSEQLLSKLSYSMFKLLVPIEDDTKRSFYEIECINGNWSVRELKRQISSLYYERSGLSLNKEKLSELAQQGAEGVAPQLAIRDPYIFEFLGLRSEEVMSESHLEGELLKKIEIFLLELGDGFCFEAKQKRILIGNTHNFVDLVFYHRILKCHVLVELKLDEFNHENIGQLNTYVSWYKKNMMTEDDNLPIGILLCTNKDHALVEYALAGMDDNLFVSKYQLELPKKEDMQKFIEEKLRDKEL
jgi:predicted nuclease of restriction endonuclease-like (RecB) superfamily